MNEILDYIKDLFSFFWKKSKTKEDREIKKYEYFIFFFVVFIVIYSSYFIIKLDDKIHKNSPVIVQLPPTNNPDYNVIIYEDTNQFVPEITSTNKILSDEFYIGEVVGIRYFGIFGIVTQKILTTSGYTYDVRWRDNEKGLPKDNFYSWELYRPEKGTVPLSAIQN